MSATLTTDYIGTTSDPTVIQNILDSAQYSASIYDAGGTLRSMDNSNSHWELYLSPDNTPTISFNINNQAITLSFSTPTEYTGAALLLRSSDDLAILQYRQENNVSNYNFVDFGFNAVFSASYQMPYGSTFTLPAVAAPVDEPGIALLLALGLPVTGIARRIRRAA